MKFAKVLNEDLVPEWSAKYFDYKTGKKKIKAIDRALKDAYRNTPKSPFNRKPDIFRSSPLRTAFSGNSNPSNTPPSGWTKRRPSSSDDEDIGPLEETRRGHGQEESKRTPVINIPSAHTQQPFRRFSAGGNEDALALPEEAPKYMRYGSIVASPPRSNPTLSRPATLNLPDPALDPETNVNDIDARPFRRQRVNSTPLVKTKSNALFSANAFEVGKTRLPFRRNVTFASRHMSISSPLDGSNGPERPLLQRLFSPRRLLAKTAQSPDVPLGALQNIDGKQDEFFEFLDQQLEKIESFYKTKEGEATERLKVLREQLHLLADQRIAEVMRQDSRRQRRNRSNGTIPGTEEYEDEIDETQGDFAKLPSRIADFAQSNNPFHHPVKAVRQVHWKKAPRHPNMLATPANHDRGKDYAPRAKNPEIPYLTAKRKLKTAMLEFYRGLELLKSFAVLNNLAFRKINKKFDKTIKARPTMRYVTEKVAHANFVQSTVVDGLVVAVEDLYARYFEKGSHKIAVNKLKGTNRKPESYTGSVFRNGLFAAAGIVLGIEALVYAAQLLYDSSSTTQNETSYLLQLYGGYFLGLFLFILFCFDCMLFNQNKVNYVFVFEFDTRDNLDWRQLAELPCFFVFLLGLIMWLNFMQIGGVTMYIYYPVILIGMTLLIMLNPFRAIYPRSRQWLLTSLARLWFGPGLFAVEFRDFFLGDMFCSQTYAMGNIEVFFCLYAHHWANPAQCNSSHSRLLGFFTALPGIWRALQCMRRYYDTRNVFPHLVNCGKYFATIMSQVGLSIYRIDENPKTKAVFITFAAVNSVFCSFWDLHMDWSLLDPNAEHTFLREHLAYKHTWWYYLAMLLDPLLRFNWIFYIAFPVELQHSAVLSFAVALSEVFRRGMWILFRVENEHCSNVGLFRASRDAPLPYKISDHERQSSREALLEEHEEASELNLDGSSEDRMNGRNSLTGGVTAMQNGSLRASISATGVDLEGQTPAVQSLRRRQKSGDGTELSSSRWQTVRRRIGTIMRRAHAQDFERRRKDDQEGMHGDESDEEEELHPGEVLASDAEDLTL